MTKNEISKATEIAKNVDIDLTGVNDEILFGCGLPEFNGGNPVYVTIEQVAKLFRWQCLFLNGGWDDNEFQNCVWIAKKKFRIV